MGYYPGSPDTSPPRWPARHFEQPAPRKREIPRLRWNDGLSAAFAVRSGDFRSLRRSHNDRPTNDIPGPGHTPVRSTACMLLKALVLGASCAQARCSPPCTFRTCSCVDGFPTPPIPASTLVLMQSNLYISMQNNLHLRAPANVPPTPLSTLHFNRNLTARAST